MGEKEKHHLLSHGMGEKENTKQIENLVALDCSLVTTGFVLFSRILMLVVDESFHPISGCSMDKSVAFIKMVESKYNISLFDRLLQSAFVNNDWQTASTAGWSEKLKSNEINLETVFIDTLVNNLHDTQHHLTKKLGDFWLKRVI